MCASPGIFLRSPGQLPGLQHPATSPYRRKSAGALASAPGQTHSFLSFAHAPSHADTRTHAHTHTHTDPSPRRASTSGLRGSTPCGSPGTAPGLSPSRSTPLLTSKCPCCTAGPLPRLPNGPLTRSASPRSPNPAGQGHELFPLPGRPWVRWSSPVGAGSRAVQHRSLGSHPRAAASRGSPDAGAPRKGLWLLERHCPAPSRPLHPQGWGPRGPTAAKLRSPG